MACTHASEGGDGADGPASTADDRRLGIERRVTACNRLGLVLAVALAACAGARQASAETARALVREASFSAGASLGDGDRALALTAGLHVPVRSRLGVTFEVAYARRLDFALDRCPPPLVCVVGGEVPVTGRTVSVVPHLAVDLTPRRRRLRIRALAGVGGGHLRQRYVPGGLPAGGSTGVEHTRSRLLAAVSFGASVAAAVSPRWSLGVDVRSLHLLDEASTPERAIEPSGTLRTLRLGARVGWRF